MGEITYSELIAVAQEAKRKIEERLFNTLKLRTMTWAVHHGKLAAEVLKEFKKSFSTVEGKISKRGKLIQRLVTSGAFACQTKAMAELFGALLGEPISAEVIKGSGSDWPMGAVVVPEANPNSHTYEIGTPCLIHGNGSKGAYRLQGTSGNSLPNRGESLRAANDEEIRTTIVSLKDTSVRSFLYSLIGMEAPAA